MTHDQLDQKHTRFKSTTAVQLLYVLVLVWLCHFMVSFMYIHSICVDIYSMVRMCALAQTRIFTRVKWNVYEHQPLHWTCEEVTCLFDDSEKKNNTENSVYIIFNLKYLYHNIFTRICLFLLCCSKCSFSILSNGSRFCLFLAIYEIASTKRRKRFIEKR